jgi:ribosomal protein S18 acetylase RimI-like enzyme
MTDKPDGFFLESATPAYYNRLFRANGFTVLSTYQSIILPSIEGFLLANTAELDAKPFEKITLRYVNPDNYEADLRAIHQLSLASFKDNFLFTPYPWESFIEKYRMLEFVASPEMTLLAEYKGQIIGYIFMIPDFLDPNSTRCVLKTYCVHPHFRSIGLSSYMTRYFLKQMKQRGFEQCIIAYVINEGVSQHMFNQSSEVFREYSLYACTL